MPPMVPIPPIWIALPPEVNTGLLMAGAGPIPMAKAATAWEALAAALEAQATELGALLNSLAAAWTGSASERAIAASTPMVIWLQALSELAANRGARATAQAVAYGVARVATPPLVEIAANHALEAALVASNFMGCNTAAIAACQADYVRMWIQAGLVMDGYEADSMFNTAFVPVVPALPIMAPAAPATGVSTVARVTGELDATAPAAEVRDGVIRQVSTQAPAESEALQNGYNQEMANAAATSAEGKKSLQENLAKSAAERGADAAARANAEAQLVEANTEAQIQTQTERAMAQATQLPQQFMQVAGQAGQLLEIPQQFAQLGGQAGQLMQGVQMGTQLGAQAMQVPQQLGQMVQAPLQQIAQPLQQMTSMLSHGTNMASSHGMSRTGMLGTNSLSSHPMLGGQGNRAGSGLTRASSLPGAGGSAPRTAMLSHLLDKVEKPLGAAGAAAGKTVAGGSAPVGGGAGGGGAPVKSKKKPESEWKPGLDGTVVLIQDLDWDDSDDW